MKVLWCATQYTDIYLYYKPQQIRLRSSQVRDECGSSYAHYIRINIATPATPKGIDTTVESPIISGGVSRRGKRVLFEAQSRASTGYDFYPETYPGATVCCGVDWVSPIKHQIDFMKV